MSSKNTVEMTASKEDLIELAQTDPAAFLELLALLFFGDDQ
jgi:hypothetical protein